MNPNQETDWLDWMWFSWLAAMAWSLTLGYECAVLRLVATSAISDTIATPDGISLVFDGAPLPAGAAQFALPGQR